MHIKGYCPSDSTYFNDQEVAQIAKCAFKAFDAQTEATFFWTAHNEIEPRWDWVKAHARGWFDRDSNATAESASADSATRADNSDHTIDQPPIINQLFNL